MIDIRKLKELVKLMKDNDLTELDLRDSEEQVTLRRPNASSSPQLVAAPAHAMHMPALMMPPAAHHVPMPAVAPSGSATAGVIADDDAGLLKIESPMVGTFYSSPNPDSPPFVSAGAEVAPDKVVCIIEAMKIFNEIKAECTGTIQKVLVKSGQAVEFGQPLFLVKPG